MASNLLQRVGFVAVAIPIAILVIYQGGWLLAGLLALVGVLGANELYRLARQREIRALTGLGLVGAAGPALVAYAAMGGWVGSPALSFAWIGIAVGWVLLSLIGVLAARRPDERPLATAAVTLFGALYAGALPAFLVTIRHAGHGTRSWEGTGLVFFPLVVTWVCDTAAMFAGRTIGGPKLAPTVSPGKTRVGALAGVVGGVLVVPVYWALVSGPAGWAMSLPQGLVLGAGLTVMAQLGDLVESLFKREAGVKDSSALIPGHGGILDRFDSLYFVIPMTAFGYAALGVI